MFYSILSKLFVILGIFMVLYTHKIPDFSVKGFSVSVLLYCFVVFIFGILSAAFFFKSKMKLIENDALKQKIKKEASEINSQEYKDKIDRLNAKIETLEVALKDALSKK